MKHFSKLDARLRLKPVVRHQPSNNPDQLWFKVHPSRIYRIRPKRHDEPGLGFLILKKLAPGCRQFVSIGPEGSVLADNDEVLGKVYHLLRDGKAGVIFPHDGTVVGQEELDS